MTYDEKETKKARKTRGRRLSHKWRARVAWIVGLGKYNNLIWFDPIGSVQRLFVLFRNTRELQLRMPSALTAHEMATHRAFNLCCAQWTGYMAPELGRHHYRDSWCTVGKGSSLPRNAETRQGMCLEYDMRVLVLGATKKTVSQTTKTKVTWRKPSMGYDRPGIVPYGWRAALVSSLLFNRPVFSLFPQYESARSRSKPVFRVNGHRGTPIGRGW